MRLKKFFLFLLYSARLCVTFENLLSLENEKKNEFFFCILLANA